jgi:RimJ/RimL family protein N-acetyltransferase
MPAVLRTLMAEIIVPYMNAHTVHGAYFEHNLASRRVFEKNGFSFETLAPDAIPINPAKLNGVEGKNVGIGVMKWERRPAN